MKIKIILFLTLYAGVALGQISEKMEFGGYVKDVQTVFIPSPDSMPWFSDNTIENRLRFKYLPTNWLTFNAESRTRLVYGDFVRLPGYMDNMKQHMGEVDLSVSTSEEFSYLAHAEFDRLNIEINLGKWQLTAGRQRVNWGQNLIWNPNDVVNTYNYFNFEYEERSGVDGVTAKYYPSYSSMAEVVWVYHSDVDSMIATGLYRFNLWGYDFQVLGGMVQTDWTLGTGWTGSVGSVSFRGEATYLAPRFDNGVDDAFIASVSADYSFGEHNHYIHGGVLYNSAGKTSVGQSVNMFQQTQVSPRSLSRGKGNLFGQYSMQPTPLITLGVSSIVNPIDGSAFISPTASLSISSNFDFSAVAVLFVGEEGDEYGGVGQMGYIKFKYNF